MVSKFSFPLFLLLVVSFITPVKADLLLEPLIGFSSGNFESKIDEKEHSASGFSYGGRVGYQNLGFQLGVDYLNSALGVDKKDWSDLDVSEWAAFIGYKFPLFLRIYAGYILRSVADTDYLDQELEFENGSGTKFGVGFTGLPFVNINFEMRQGTWDQYILNDTTVKEATKFNTFMIGISIPFTL